MTNHLKIFQWTIHLFVIYSYFLIYAQFGFLRYLQSFNDPLIIKQIMPLMLIGAFCSGMLIRFREVSKIKLYLLSGFFIAIVAAASPIFFKDLKYFYGESFLIGLSIGTLTILSTTTLYNHLRYFEVIFVAAFSTALAYFFCNIPWLHYNTPIVISSVASGLGVLGLVNCSLISWEDKRLPRQNIRIQSDRQFYLVVLLFFVILFIDSYSFYIIQNNESLMKYSWGEGYCFNQGLFHVLGAFLAYHFLTQKQIHYLLCVVMFLFCISIHRIGGESSFVFAHFYAIAIAMYSTALISYPANFSDSFEKRKKVTTDLYLVAGWLGSGLGVVFADQKSSVSFEFFTVLLIIYTIILSLAALSNSRVRIAAFLVMTLLLQRLHSNEIVNLGRQVYINEGCINCHSQYVRPNTKDVINWGPFRTEQLLENPPLIGNRRIGPDLLNVGLRRSTEWNRLHLTSPSRLSPNTVMPSYSHLFEDSKKGTHLLSYLESLGKGHLVERLKAIQSWIPELDASNNGKELYENMCIQCHGKSGKGDGVVAKLLKTKVADLSLKKYKYITNLSKSKDRVALAKIIKFGIFGTSMPGHESLSDSDIMALVDYSFSLKD